MKYLIFILIISSYVSCSDSALDDEAWECINMKIAEFDKLTAENEGFGGSTNVPQSISEFIQDGKTYYFVDHGIAFDAPGYILDDTCEEVCRIQSQEALDGRADCHAFNDVLSGAVKIWPTE